MAEDPAMPDTADPVDMIIMGSALLILREAKKMTAATEALEALIKTNHEAVLDILGDFSDMQAKITELAAAVSAASTSGDIAAVDAEVNRLAAELKADVDALVAKAASYPAAPVELPVEAPTPEPAPVVEEPVPADVPVEGAPV